MSAKRIILLYITEISGHHSATLAIEKALKMLDANIEILNINAFNYTNPITEKIIHQLYTTVIKKTPQIWEYLYDNPKIVKKIETFKRGINKFNSPKLKRLFGKFKPDVVTCTQAFPCGMVAGYKKRYKSDITLVAVLTDYVPHSYWIYDEVDYYVVPSEEVGNKLAEKGIAPEKIKPFGIPFDPKFNDPVDKGKILQKLNLLPGLPNVLIMGGGQGLGPIKTIIRSLEKVKEDFQEIIVTGTNKKLYRSLKKTTKNYKKNIALLGYVNTINELMSISDIIITKPGGITTSECLAKKLPLVIIKPIPGQETNNACYLTSKNAAIKIEDPHEIRHVIEDLLKNPEKLKFLSESAGKIGKPFSSIDIAKLLLNKKPV